VKIRKSLVVAMSAVACWSVSSRPAAASEVLYDSVGFLQGTQSFSDSFSVSSPGTLTVTLGNVGWPQPLSSLNLLVSSASGALGPEMGAGTSTFNVTSGNVFTQWFGTAQGPLNAGVYSLEIQFQPGGSSGNPVPLPTSIALLLSGMGLLIWQRRTRAENIGQNLDDSPGVTAT
jgi:hypothetical protein